MRSGLVAIAIASVAVACSVGCGGGAADARPVGSSLGQHADAAGRAATLKVVSSRYGAVVADSRGEALYVFTKDRRGPSRCYGSCAKAWPPFLTQGKPRVGAGIDARRLGTTRRTDGKLQVTYRGQPLYYYVQDRPGVILCQNVTEFGGTWLVVAPSGRAIR